MPILSNRSFWPISGSSTVFPHQLKRPSPILSVSLTNHLRVTIAIISMFAWSINASATIWLKPYEWLSYPQLCRKEAFSLWLIPVRIQCRTDFTTSLDPPVNLPSPEIGLLLGSISYLRPNKLLRNVNIPGLIFRFFVYTSFLLSGG